jgi:polyisoprenyl-phosphate glycosyltransferase
MPLISSPLPRITIIVPVKDEEENIAHFIQQFYLRVPDTIAVFTFLFIDDGSTDKTSEILRQLSLDNEAVQFIQLTRNFGKEAAMTAGIDHADCDAAIIMDVDLQHPPELVPEFIKQWQQGYQTVFGMRVSRNQDTSLQRICANSFYKVFNKASTVPIPGNAGDFRLISLKVIKALKRLPERNRFMKGLFVWPGYSSIGIPYEVSARAMGHSKFNTWKLWNFAIDGIASFSTMPLRFWTYFGAAVAFAAFMYMLQIVIRTLIFGNPTPGYSSLMAAVLLLGGIQLISTGILGEYIGRLYVEVKGRPLYLVEKHSKNINPQPYFRDNDEYS